MNRHEIPTHLEVEDKILGTLTVRQMLFLTVGVSVGYALWGALAHFSLGERASWHLFLVLRAMIGLFPCVVSLLLALTHPAGRPLEEWLLAVARYSTLPKIYIWHALIEPEEPDEVSTGAALAALCDRDDEEEGLHGSEAARSEMGSR